MPRRYICRDCKNVKGKNKTCSFCAEEMEVLEYDITLEGVIPYILAAAAGLLILISFLFNYAVLIWLTFPLIAIGLIVDHLFQKKLDKEAKEELLKGIKSR